MFVNYLFIAGQHVNNLLHKCVVILSDALTDKSVAIRRCMLMFAAFVHPKTAV